MARFRRSRVRPTAATPPAAFPCAPCSAAACAGPYSRIPATRAHAAVEVHSFWGLLVFRMRWTIVLYRAEEGGNALQRLRCGCKMRFWLNLTLTLGLKPVAEGLPRRPPRGRPAVASCNRFWRALHAPLTRPPIRRAALLAAADIGPEGAEALGEWLATDKKCVELNLYSNDLGDKGCAFVSGALKTNKVPPPLAPRCSAGLFPNVQPEKAPPAPKPGPAGLGHRSAMYGRTMYGS